MLTAARFCSVPPTNCCSPPPQLIPPHCWLVSRLDLLSFILFLPPIPMFFLLKLPPLTLLMAFSNATQTFQRLMDHLLRNLPLVFVYLDDILVASPDFSSHLSHLTAFFDILRANGFLVNLTKCVFARPFSPFSATLVTATGISPLTLMPFTTIHSQGSPAVCWPH